MRKITNRENYWSIQDRIKQTSGQYPPKTFDFVSVHPTYPKGFSLCAPMILVEANSLHRLSWEQAIFPRKQDAINFAKQVTPTVVVTCDC